VRPRKGAVERGCDAQTRDETCRPDETGRDEAGKSMFRPGNKRHAVERLLRGCCPISRVRVLASWATNWAHRNADCMFCLSLHGDRLSCGSRARPLPGRGASVLCSRSSRVRPLEETPRPPTHKGCGRENRGRTRHSAVGAEYYLLGGRKGSGPTPQTSSHIYPRGPHPEHAERGPSTHTHPDPPEPPTATGSGR